MVLLADLLERVEPPRGACACEPEDGGEVVGEDDVGEPGAVDEARGLEDLFVLLCKLLSRRGFRGLEEGGILPGAALVDVEDFARNVLGFNFRMYTIAPKVQYSRYDCD